MLGIMGQSVGFIKIGCVMGFRTVGITVTSNIGLVGGFSHQWLNLVGLTCFEMLSIIRPLSPMSMGANKLKFV